MEIEKRLSELRVKSRDIIDRRDLLYRTHTKLESEYENLRERQEKLISFLWDEYELTYSDASRRCAEKITEKREARPSRRRRSIKISCARSAASM